MSGDRHRLPSQLGLPVVLVVAFLLRLGWVLGHPRLPLVSDPLFYHLTATLIARGQGFVDPGTHLPTAYYSPGYPYFLGFWYWLFGAHVAIARALNVLLSTGMVYLTWRLGKRLFSEPAGLLGASVLAILPGQIIWTSAVMSEPLFGCLGLLALEVAWSRRAWRAVPLGLLLGLLLLVRSQAILLLPACLWGLYEPASGRTFLSRAVLTRIATCGFIALLTLTPWLVRNQRVFGHPVLSTNSGVNLVMGVFPGATGSYVSPRAFDGLVHLPPRGNEYAVNQAYLQAGMRMLEQDPWHELRLVPTKIFVFFRSDLASLEVNQVATADQLWGLARWALGRGARPALPAEVVADILAAQLSYMAMLLLAALGTWRAFRSHPDGVRLLGLVVVCFAAFHGLYVAPERYHFFLVPCIALLAGTFLAGRIPRSADRGRERGPAGPPPCGWRARRRA